MDMKKISINTQSRLSNQSLFYLLKEENFEQIEKNDKNKILLIKKKLNENLNVNLFLISSAYVFVNILFIRKIKNNFFNRISELSCISGISYLGAYYTYKKNIFSLSKEIKEMKTKYSLLIKNSLLLKSCNENKNFNWIDFHYKYDYSQLNFLFLILIRLFVR